MKKLIILVILLMTIFSCTSEDIRIWNENTKERKERMRDCYRDPYYGDIHCGYRR